MPPPEKLGGFKVLKDVARISVISQMGAADFPLRVFRALADAAINLPYATCILDGRGWGLSIAVGDSDGDRASRAIQTASHATPNVHPTAAVLSIFPHRKNPEIIRAFFEALGREGIPADALASSPSAVSILIDQGILTKASHALFGPFTFSAYRTPEDWKLAQEGKEQLYKEVVASYQEKRPKVYGLEYYEGQTLVQMRFDTRFPAALGSVFGRLAPPGIPVTFLAAGPCPEPGWEQVAFCLPLPENAPCLEGLGEETGGANLKNMAPAAVFSMNGPHFGDRYGIVSELLEAFAAHRIDLLGLSCTIASITGVVRSEQLVPATEAIQARFDIPAVINRT